MQLTVDGNPLEVESRWLGQFLDHVDDKFLGRSVAQCS